MFVVNDNDTEPQSEGHTYDILCELTEVFDKLCDPKINPNLAKEINEVWGKILRPEKFVKNLRQEACGPNKSRHYTSMLLNF